MKYWRWLFAASLIAALTSAAWAVDLNESFDEVFFPPVSWQSLETGDGVNLWVRTTGNTHSGSGKAHISEEDLGSGLVAERWLISPRLHVNNVGDALSFWARTQYSFITDNDSLYVRLSTTDSLTASFTTELEGYKCGSGGAFINEYVQLSSSLADYVGQDIFIAFVHRDEGDGGNQVYLDDVTGPELLAPPNRANTPNPADNATGVPANTNLTWVNGTGTNTIDLYLAQTQDSIDNLIAAARKITNTLATSYDPPWDLLANQAYFWKVVTRNAYGETQGPLWDFTVVGGPLSGSYDIGGGNNNYADFSAAANALTGNGVSGPVTFRVYGGDYNDTLKLGAITGADATNTITFVDQSGTARLNYTGPQRNSVVYFNGADYVTLNGIDILAGGDTKKCVRLEGTAQHNRFRNAKLTGNGFVSSISYCVYMLGANNDDNIFQDDSLTNARNGFYITSYSGAGQQTAGFTIERCAMDNVWIGVYCTYQDGLHVRDCDIQLNGAGSTGGYGLQVDTYVDGDTAYFYRNKVHNIIASGQSGMVRANPGALARVVRIYNNFLYDLGLTGTAQMRGISAESGTIQIYYNSLRCNDIAATATTNAVIYTTAGSTGSYDIRDNILVSLEQTNTTYGIYCLLTPSSLTMDYNAHYHTGTIGTVYRTAYLGTSPYYWTFTGFRDSTVYEDHGVEGFPGFLSATNLHIADTVNLVSNIGIPISGIGDDIDQQARSIAVPDIGADEYTYLAPPADYAVTEFIGLQSLYSELTPVNVRARVVNRGSAGQTDVPVVLFYEGAAQDTVPVSLAPDAVDTVVFDWTTPVAPDTGFLEAQSFLVNDARLSNDSVRASVVIVGQPMHGTYDIGGGSNHYPSFSLAVRDLTLRGIDGAVTFQVYGTTYTDTVYMGPITGASATNTITFVEHTVLDEPVEITSASTLGTVRLNGADYVTFAGIDIRVTGSAAAAAARIYNNADCNTIRNCSVYGANVTNSACHGLYISGGGNDYNRFENCTVSGGYYGIRLSGTSGTADIGNEVVNCAVLEGKYGVYTEYQPGGRVHNCDIQPGWAAATTEIYGLYAYGQPAGDTLFFYNNRIHNLRVGSSAATNGIYATTGTVLRAYNNFVYDFQSTGTGAVYGLRVYAGSVELYFNSVYIGDVTTTGGTPGINGFYQAGGTAYLENNIFQIEEPTSACWGINRNAGTLTSDYNCVYSSGPGAAYNMGRDGTTAYVNLAAWQAGTAYDDHSVEGNPGFFSATNLHIQATFDLVDSAGTAIAGIATDIDGQARAGVPDIGADEYLYISLAHDYGIVGFIGLLPTYTSSVPYVIQADVQNNGANNETNVPVILFYNNAPQDTVLLSLLSLAHDTVDFNWTPPAAECEAGELKAKGFCPSDGYAPNDSLTAAVTVIGGPMHGTYDLGGGNMDFATFTEAIACLSLRGIDGEVIIEAYTGTYNENLTVAPINGVNFVDRVIFRNHPSPLDDIVTLTSSIAAPVVVVNGGDFVTFDGIDMVGTGACDSVVVIKNDADYVTFENLSITGRDSTQLNCKGIRLWLNGNDNCVMDNVTVRGVFYGMICQSGSGQSDNWEIKNCHISGASYCIYLNNNHNARVHDNDLQPHGYGSTSAYGVYASIMSAGDTVYVYNNRIHNLRHTSVTSFPEVAGIWAGSNRVAYVFNNFIWDWQTNGPDIAGIHGSTGTTYCAFNSIRMNDVANAGEFAGIHVGTGTTYAYNNILVVEETTDTCYSIWREGGTLNSDYNCFNGASPLYSVGRDGSVSFATLPDWQTIGHDLNGVAGDPGFRSPSDLHIDSTHTLVNNVGLAIPEVTSDIDGDPRGAPPDIGADEYEGIYLPDPVTDLTVAADVATEDVILRWSATTHANSYRIYAGPTPDVPIEPTYLIGTTAETTFTHIDALMLPDRLLFYVVIASSEPVAR